MKKKILSLILLAAMALSLSAGLFGCQDKNAHTHAYPTIWQQTHSEHWRQCAVTGCDQVLAKGAHTFDTGSITTPPTPEADGVKTYLCTTCGYAKTAPIIYVAPNTVTQSEWWDAMEEASFYNVTATLQITLVENGFTQSQTVRIECTPYWARESLLTESGWVELSTEQNQSSDVGTGFLMTFLSQYFGLYDSFLYTENDDSYHFLRDEGYSLTLTFAQKRLALAVFNEVDGENSLTTSISFSDYGTTTLTPPTALDEETFLAACSAQAFENVTLETISLCEGYDFAHNTYYCANGTCFSLNDGAPIELAQIDLVSLLFRLGTMYADFTLDEALGCYRAESLYLELGDNSLYLVEALLYFEQGVLSEMRLYTDAGYTLYLGARDYGTTELEQADVCPHVWAKTAQGPICRYCLTPFAQFTLPEQAQSVEMAMPLGNGTGTVVFYPEYSLVLIGPMLCPVFYLGGDIIEISEFDLLRRIDVESMTLSDDLHSVYDIAGSCTVDGGDGSAMTADFYQSGFVSLIYTDAQGEVTQSVYGSFSLCGSTIVCETEEGLFFFSIDDDGTIYML